MKRTPFKWLDRRIAAPGPFMTLCLHEHEFAAACRHLKVDLVPWIKTSHAHATAHCFRLPGKPSAVIVALNDWHGRDAVDVAGLLIHEAVHVWQRYAEDIGEHSPGDEQEAYAIQSIAQALLAEFARRMVEVGKAA